MQSHVVIVDSEPSPPRARSRAVLDLVPDAAPVLASPRIAVDLLLRDLDPSTTFVPEPAMEALAPLLR